MVEWMTQNHPDELAAVERTVSLDGAELEQWRDVAAKLYVPEPDPASGLIEQFAGFFEHEDITPAELKARLIDPGEYWGWPNGIAFETQVSKQADVTQLFVLHPTAYDRTIMRANWEYYEPRTQHGSSLSPAVYAIVAAWVGHMDEATRYFLKSCTVDLYNDNKAISGGTFIGGIHTAACGISWQIVVLGFAGMYLTEDGFGFAPHIPEAWQQLSFSLTRWGRTVRVIVARTQRTAGSEHAAGAEHTSGAKHAAGTTSIASEGSPYRLEVRAHQENGSSLGISWGAQHVAIAPGDSAILGA
jgi:kojibiose phosphorylase